MDDCFAITCFYYDFSQNVGDFFRSAPTATTASHESIRKNDVIFQETESTNTVDK